MESLITYVNLSSKNIYVYLGGKCTGMIMCITGEGWTYLPSGQSEGGEFFDTLALCKQSLEMEE